MLKISLITILACLIHVNTSFSQKQEVTPESKVNASEVNSNKLQKPKKLNYKSTSTETSAETNKNIESSENQEYPKRITSGTPHKNSSHEAQKELSKEEEIQKLEEKIISAEWKIEFLKEESETGNTAEIEEKEAALEILKNELLDLKK
jgi:dolichyl-phosphate-mannose--protein O-mannosyl transferase